MVKAREREELKVLPTEDELGEPVERLPAVPAKPAEEPMGETPDSVELYLNEIARYKLLRPDEEVSLAKEIENGRILDELSDAYMEEHLTAPTTEQLAQRLLRQIRDGLILVRRSRAIKGFPQKGHGDQLFFEQLRESIQDHLDEAFEEQIATESVVTARQMEAQSNAYAESLTYFPDPAGFVIGPDDYLEHLRKVKAAVNVPVVASLNGVRLAGLMMPAAAQDPAAAGLMGVNINLVLALCFGFGAALASIAGMLISMCYPVHAAMGGEYLVIAIIVVVLGGLGSIPGSFIGGFILGLVGNIVTYFEPGLALAAYYAIFILLLLLATMRIP